MPTPSPEIIRLLSVFAVAMTAPTFAKSLVLIYGTILTPGIRTVSAVLRVMGLGDLETFGNYHRVLNRDRWSPWVMSQLLLALLIRVFIPDGIGLIILIDETLERRQGKRIAYKGRFRDAVRSTAQKVVTCLGIRWCCLALLVEVPWSGRPWALPFLIVPVLAPTHRPTPPAAGTWADQRALAQAPPHQCRLGAVCDREGSPLAARPGHHVGRGRCLCGGRPGPTLSTAETPRAVGLPPALGCRVAR
jgi:hypothetical protein